MDYNKKLMFSAVVHGFHFYRRAWVPTKSEKLVCAHDTNNPFDDFANLENANFSQEFNFANLKNSNFSREFNFAKSRLIR